MTAGEEYPLRWRWVNRRGYGEVVMVPCRLIHKGRARWTIAALRADGTEAVRAVKPENVIDPSSSGASVPPEYEAAVRKFMAAPAGSMDPPQLDDYR